LIQYQAWAVKWQKVAVEVDRRELGKAGASSIETSKLVGHVAINTTADYTIIGQAREAELVDSVCERLLPA